MMVQILSPRMQHRQEADTCAEVLWICSDLHQGLCSSAKENAIDHSLILQRQWSQLVWQRKDNMEVIDWEKFSGALLEPLSSGCRLAFRAMAIAARVIGDYLVAATVALLDMAAKSRGAAADDIVHDSPVLGREGVAEGGVKAAKDVS